MGQPRLGRQAVGFKGFDLIGLAQCQPDVVQAIDQAELAEGLHLKSDFFTLRLDDHLALQIDGEGSRPFLKQLLKKMSA